MKLLLTLLAITTTLTEAGVLFKMRNYLPDDDIWIGIRGDNGQEHLENGGFLLSSLLSRTVTAPGNWSGEMWARTYCNETTHHCLTGDCGNVTECKGNEGEGPVTVIKISLGDIVLNDTYFISLEKGFNIDVSMAPGQGTGLDCERVQCGPPILKECPEELKVLGPKGTVVGCKSACAAFNTDEYCCRGQFGTKQTCDPSKWSKNYDEYFKHRCPNSSTNAFDEGGRHNCTRAYYLVSWGKYF